MQKKSRRIILLITAVSLFLNCTFVTSDFSILNEGSTYTYNIKNSTWILNTTANYAQGTGLQFLGHQFAIDSRFTVQINTIDQYFDEISFTLSFLNDHLKIKNTNSTASIYSLTHFHTNILMIDDIWNQGEMDLGPYLLSTYFFFDIKNFNETFSLGPNFESINFRNFGFDTWSTIGDHLFEETRKTFMFIFSYEFLYRKILPDPLNQSENIFHDYTGNFKLKIEYDSETGVLKGYNLLLDSSGIYNNKAVAYHVEQVISEKGFQIGEFEEIEEVPNISTLAVFFALTIISSLSIIIRKKKKVKSNTQIIN